MADPLSALRATVSAMTPGPWEAHRNRFDTQHMLYEAGVAVPLGALDSYDTNGPGPTKRQREANATGIVSAVAIARFVADPESLDKLATDVWDWLGNNYIDRESPEDIRELIALVFTRIARAANA